MLSSRALRELARGAGFSEAGFAPALPIDGEALRRWVSEGHAADMGWMAERLDDRLDIRRLLPGARAVLALGAGFSQSSEVVRPGPIAQYARGRDYHYVVRDRVRALRRRLVAAYPGLQTYASVDSNPVMEKVWAERAGLGFIGKSGLLINPRLGTQLVLAVMVLDREVDAWDHPAERQCGDCELCLRACPSAAIVRPGVVDARRCLSYQTIENEGSVPEELRPALGDTVFGCDACQTCCPWNGGARARPSPDDLGFSPRALARLPTEAFAALTWEEYQRLIPGSALARAGFHGLRRNALLSLGARRAREHLPLIEGLLDDGDPRVSEAARWARAHILEDPG